MPRRRDGGRERDARLARGALGDPTDGRRAGGRGLLEVALRGLHAVQGHPGHMEQPYTTIDLDLRDNGKAIEAALLSLTQRSVPNVFVGGQLLGGSAEMQEAAATGLLCELLEGSNEAPTGCVVPTRGPRSAAAE